MASVPVASLDILQKHHKLLQVVQETTSSVFATMVGMTVTSSQISLEKQSTVVNAGLAAMVGMAGPVSGSGCLAMSKSFGCYAASRFLMAEYSDVNDDVLDAVAEITNMIVGGLKTALEEDLGPMGLSIPTVVFGESYVTRSPSMVERMVISFRCEDEGIEERDFTVTVCLVSERQNRNYLRELAEFHARLT
jgi:chemotaxis protein CheX